MKSLVDPNGVLAGGLAAIRDRYKVPAAFPPEVVSAAESAARRPLTDHADRTAWPFVTLDPATSTDLDQAFVIDRDGEDLVLRYAIADVAWFVDDGGPLDVEAWKRGETLYLPDGKAGLYPPVLSEAAASLLPGAPKAAVIFSVRVAPDGAVRLDGAERAVIRSTAKLAYDRVQPSELPAGFAELADRIRAAEDRRGASRVDPPEQEVSRREDGRFELRFRPRAHAEDQNAALSLATNLAVADLLHDNATGLFRVMAEPDARAVRRLRQTAKAFDVAWPAHVALGDFERTLDPRKPKDAALMMAIRRAGRAAAYEPYSPERKPWHAAMAARYAHATAPLRRLADRYVVTAALAVANGRPVPEATQAAFARLPEVMARADAKAAQVERAVIDLAEVAVLQGREAETFRAVVTDLDERGARIQLCEDPIVARVAAANAGIGDVLYVRLAPSPAGQSVAFQRVD
ncbi:RNB domain-containing ribonuclease [Phenylobacterium sp. J367]|uniref:RNB domain-containing ribonuclease n=1 Tax=Phenylobacterium sp. J367 TaxID=2898435 RepID=UPI002151376F|nr:RNB domain-containing ribonuclease [Phenylobacterium sp. J367]MCR5879237.1 RNB domain-containing ribonuclease [Phenylobacterium sp. J367]